VRGSRATSAGRTVIDMVRPTAQVVDAAVAVGAAALAVAAVIGDVALGDDVPIAGARWWTLPLLLVPAAALLVRRRSPVLTVIGVWVPAAAHAVLTGQAATGLFLVVAGWVSLYSLVAYGVARQILVGLAIAAACLVVHDVNDPNAFRGTAEQAWSAAFWDVLVAGSALVGGAVRATRRARRLAAEQLAAQRDRAEREATAVKAERARIARELHDVVTHHVNAVVLQAVAVSSGLDAGSDPGDVRMRQRLDAIERSARDALGEMRRMLHVLTDLDGPQHHAPQPGLDDLDRLVQGARDCGLTVDAQLRVTPAAVPAAVGLAGYRIVQEALTNVSTHAPGARVRVVLDGGDGAALDVLVEDDGAADSSRPISPNGAHGRGLLGMRERVALFGGSLTTGPRAEGGFRVHATLPPAER
jgi:signal transduction histidine kinase